MQAVLGVLAEAVLVPAAGGEIVYANRAAATMVGARDERELIDGGIARAWQDFEVRDERGEPIDPTTLPGRRALAGDPSPEPVLLRVTQRSTGEVFWRLVKATPVASADGRRLAVNGFEDHTEARRDELKQRFLAGASEVLNSSLDIDVTLDKVAWAEVPQRAD